MNTQISEDGNSPEREEYAEIERQRLIKIAFRCIMELDENERKEVLSKYIGDHNDRKQALLKVSSELRRYCRERDWNCVNDDKTLCPYLEYCRRAAGELSDSSVAEAVEKLCPGEDIQEAVIKLQAGRREYCIACNFQCDGGDGPDCPFVPYCFTPPLNWTDEAVTEAFDTLSQS